MELVGEGWKRHHERVYERPGPVLDIGCWGWDWSLQFAGRKEIIGYDPQEFCLPAWATEFHREAVGPWDGCMVSRESVLDPVCSGPFCLGQDVQLRTVPMRSFASVLKQHTPALVKLNVEGAEYAILTAVDHPVADQLIVSFHGWPVASWGSKELAMAIVQWLRRWYDATEIDQRWEWWMFLAK